MFEQSYSSILLLIVIVNYRTSQLTINCLESIEKELKCIPKTFVIVVDNASQDSSIELINATINQKNWHGWVATIALPNNQGYSAGNNAAICKALEWDSPPRYFLLLNPDTIVESQAISKLVEFMNQNPEVGIAGSKHKNSDGTSKNSAYRFDSALSELDSGLRLGIVSKLLKKWVVYSINCHQNSSVDWVSGASMMVRREVFETAGLLDENYFLYYEDEDFCWQAKKAGWSCWYVDESHIVHLKGQSTGIGNTHLSLPRLPQYWFDSRQRFFLKNYGWWYTVMADFLWLFGFILWKIRCRIQFLSAREPSNIGIDFFRNSLFIKSIYSKLK